MARNRNIFCSRKGGVTRYHGEFTRHPTTQELIAAELSRVSDKREAKTIKRMNR